MAVKTKLMTAEEFWELGDIGSAELVRGEVVMYSPTGGLHGLVEARLVSLLLQFVREHDLGVVMSGEAGVLLFREPDTVRAPDIMFFRKGKLEEIPEGFIQTPPDLVIEIVSPNDRWSDLEGKVDDYLRAGVKVVWIVDPQRKTVLVLPERKTLREGDTLEGGEILPNFSLKVADIFR